jgi:hypothetical protein
MPVALLVTGFFFSSFLCFDFPRGAEYRFSEAAPQLSPLPGSGCCVGL